MGLPRGSSLASYSYSIFNALERSSKVPLSSPNEAALSSRGRTAWPTSRDAPCAIRVLFQRPFVRHVRLRRGFANIQSIHGVQTLRIPQTLLQEKRRTQIRVEGFALAVDPARHDREHHREAFRVAARVLLSQLELDLIY